MTYREPLLSQSGHLGRVYALLTKDQLAKFAEWSIIKERDVLSLLRQADFMAEDAGDGRTVTLTGMLPLCSLYGCMLPDGSTHT